MKFRFAFLVAVNGLALPAATAPASAVASGLTKAWVSSHGVDGASCGPVVSPCRTFNGALAVVAAGGEIDVLDPGAYGPGPVNITQSVSIVNDGVGTAGVQNPASGGDAIFINAPGANVLLRGLSLTGSSGLGNGVNVITANSLIVDHCSIKYFQGFNTTGNGLLVAPAAGFLELTVSDTLLAGNLYTGAWVLPATSGLNAGSTGSVKGSFVRVNAVDTQYGVSVGGWKTSGQVLIIADQVDASNNSSEGFEANTANLYLTRTVVTGNAVGVANDSYVHTYGDNAINGNGIDITNPLDTSGQNHTLGTLT